jgi:hypothetical protein
VLNAQYGEETLSQVSLNFSEGRKGVSKRPHAHVLPTALRDVIIRRVEELIFGNRQITVRDIASSSDIIVGIVEIIIHENLLFKEVCVRRVPKTLMFDQKAQYVAICAEYLA